MTELQRTMQYFLMVVHSLWRENWSKTVKTLLLLLSTILIIDCLVLIGLFGGFPGYVTQLINDFSAELRTGLTRLAFAILAFGLLFPFLFVYEAAKIHERQETDKRKLNSKVRSLQKSQKDRDRLRHYDEVEISYRPLAETLEEKRAGYRTHRATETRRLSYFIANKGEVTIKACRIKITGILLKDSPHNYYEDTTNMPIEHNAIKWNNSNDERINLGLNSWEPIVLAKIPDNNAFAIFHFVTFGDEKRPLSEKIPRTFEGTWDVSIQIEGQIEIDGIMLDLIPILYVISFRFENFSLVPLDVKKYGR